MSLRAAFSVTLCVVFAFSCGKPVPPKAESGFDMAKHSLPFANFANGYAEATLNTESMQRMFGVNVCKTQMSPCELTVAANAFMNKANKSMLGGRCEGFAVLSSLIQAQKIDATQFGGETARDLTLSDNPALQRELAYWFATQLHPSVTEKTKGYMAKDVMPVLAEALVKEGKERFRIGVVKKNGESVTGGHALTPIAYYPGESEGIYLLRVYDNNLPDVVRTMKIDTKKNRWEYEAAENPAKKSSLYFGDDSNKNPLYFAPIFTRSGELSCHFCEGKKRQITTSGGLQVLVNGVGVSGGEAKGGSVSPTFSATNDEEGAGFNMFVDSDEDLEMTIASGDDGSSSDADRGSIEVTGQSFSASVSGIKVEGEGQWQVAGDGRKQKYSNPTNTAVTVSQAIDDNGKTISVKATVQGSSDSVATEIKADGKIELQAKGAMGSSVTVEIAVTTPDGKTNQGSLNYMSEGDSTLSTDSKVLEMMGTVSGTVNNNGMMQNLGNSCEDGRKSGSESDVDCGGNCINKCVTGLSCNMGTDCRSTFCAAVSKQCVVTQCEDQAKTGDESDVDCGGSVCAKCGANKACMTSLDCAPGLACDGLACKPSFVVSVAVTGLAVGGTVTLTNATNSDSLTFSSNDTQPFPSRIVGPYSVSITQQPATGLCTLTNGSGTATADVTLSVTCIRTHSIGGALSGLANGQSLVVLNNGGDAETLSADGAFVFSNRVTGTYAVTIMAQPMGQTCAVTNGSGTATNDVTNVAIACGASGFTVGGTLSGLPGLASVTLQNNGGNPLNLSANGAFAFTTPVTGAYAVTVSAQPTGATCVVTNGTGTATANVTNVSVVCTPNTYTIGGALSGLPMAQSVTLQNNGGNALNLTANGAFTFTTPVTGLYAVTVSVQPSGANCVVTNATGTATANVTNVSVVCTPTTFTIGGTLSGLPMARSVTLQNNGGNALNLNANGAFTFTTPVTGAYAVTVSVQPVGGANCTVSNGSGTATANVTNVQVICVVPSGVLDTTFNGTGYFSTSPTVFHNEFYRVATNPDNSQVWVGRNQVAGADEDWVIAKLTAAGTLDPTFGTGGYLGINRGVAIGERCKAIHRNADGSYFVAGTLRNATFDFAVAKITAAGALDTSFGTMGIVTYDNSSASETLEDMKVLADGSMVLVGQSNNVDVLVVKLTAAGAVDMGFGSTGRYVLATPSDEAALAVDVRAGTGDIFISGYSNVTGNYNAIIISLSSFGFENVMFGTSGVLNVDLSGNGVFDMAADITLESGNPVIAGWAQTNGNNDYVVAEFQSFSGLPGLLGTNGKVQIDRAGASDRAIAIKYLPMTGGYLIGGSSGTSASVLKLTNSGALDTTFGNMGQFQNTMGGPGAVANDLVLDSAGRIVIGGSFTVLGGNNPDFGAARINP